ncbi:MAG TPA: glycosyltransferase, partial [Gemmatimonadales bacterium]|nr:glycosyltransferase [Gemmatimonadales bacterium]
GAAGGTTAMKPAVAVFSTNFLEYSQTFVYEEIRHHVRYEAEVFTKRRLLPERFPFDPVHVAGPLYGLQRRSRAFDARFRERGFALVHAHFGVGAVYALPFARRHQLPLVVTFHGYDVPLLFSRQRWWPAHWRYALLGRSVLRHMRLGLCASAELRNMLIGLGVPGERLAVHRLGIDLSAFHPVPRLRDPFEVVMVGRFVEKKGFEYGIRAFARAASQAPNVRLTLVGEGPLQGELRHLTDELALGEKVSFTGPLPPAEVASRLARSHVLLAPSVVDRHGNRESGLMVVKEASAAETVPIGTLHGGIPEIIDDGVTGYLVRERDVQAMADRLTQLMTEPDRWRSMSLAARAKMQREYDVRDRARALEERYDEAIAMPRPEAARNR